VQWNALSFLEALDMRNYVVITHDANSLNFVRLAQAEVVNVGQREDNGLEDRFDNVVVRRNAPTRENVDRGIAAARSGDNLELLAELPEGLWKIV
jgi:hypothetical protein